jgi:CelD/BcsL family acetyltransferase involved in cellulose biosynthesis
MPSTPADQTSNPALARLAEGTRALLANEEIDARIQPVGPETDFARLVGHLAHTPFQSPLWLRTWFETVGRARKVQGLWLALHAHGGQAMALPLILHRQDGLTIVEMPDLGVTDYAAPLLGKRELVEAIPASTFWHAILKTLPEADVFRLERSPAIINGMANPLVTHPLALPSRMAGWSRSLPSEWKACLGSLSSKMREKLGKSRRRFGRVPASSITRITAKEEALALLPLLSHWQAERMGEKGRDYELDDPAIAAFYTQLIEAGTETGDVMMMRLRVGEETLAMNFAFREQDRVVYLRVGNTFGPWAPFALGILATKSILREAVETGAETFDFGAGDYEYKARFGGEPQALHDIAIPLSLKAWPGVLALQARRRLSRVEALKRIVTRLRGKPEPAAGAGG